jgi:RNA polymerase sigma-70 factor (ECF subfamily)
MRSATPADPNRQISRPAVSKGVEQTRISEPDVSSGTKLDREHVRTLYERHGPVLLAYALSLLQDRFGAEDVLHQVFAKLLQREVAINGQPLHYLYRAIRNTALNYRRHHAREVELAPNGHWLESPRGMEEIGLALQSALAALPDEQREIMILRAWGEMTFEEAAAVLDISPNTAASRYRYALAKLKERLKPLAKE